MNGIVYVCLKGMLICIIEYWLTVKAVTLIFISWHGSAILFAKEGKSGPFYDLVKS